MQARFNASDHWDNKYSSGDLTKLGWYEEEPQPSLDLIEKYTTDHQSRIFHAGAGTSTLIKALIAKGYSKMFVNDISEIAIDKLKASLDGMEYKIRFIHDDLTKPDKLKKTEPVDLWHDRAVLHFFHEDEEKQNYFDLVRQIIKPGGHAILAQFSTDGAKMCSALPVHGYNAEMLSQGLGPSFKLVESFDHTYIMPSGDERPYVYAVFQKST